MNHDYLKVTGESLSRKTRRRLLLEQASKRNTVNSYTYGGALSSNTERGPSGFWGDCPWNEITNDPDRGFTFFDDFLRFGLAGTQTSDINLNDYRVFSTTNDVWKADAMPTSATVAVTGQPGVISWEADAAADQGSIGTNVCPFFLGTTQVGKVWVEARIACSQITATALQIFFGLCENRVTSFAANVPLADADATASTMAMIGFNRLEDGLTVINSSYADHTATWTNIQASASSGVLAVETWIKLGMKINFQDSARCVRFYVNGVECSTAMTKAALAALTYVDAVQLGLNLSAYADGAGFLYMDWWKGAQLIGA